MAKRDPIEEFMTQYGRIYSTHLNPEDQKFVMDSLTRETEQPRSDPMSEGQSRASNLAQDLWKETPEPAKSTTETDAEKRADLKDFGHVVGDREDHETTWEQRFEDRLQASLYEGRGHTDERMVRSAGQNAESWADALRPEKGPQDMANAIREMGIEAAVERAKARETGQEKGAEPRQERGGDGIEY